MKPTPRPRKPLSEIVHYDVYGNAATGGEARPGQLPGGRLVNLLRWLRLTIRPPFVFGGRREP